MLHIDQAIANTTLNYNLQAGYDNLRIDQEVTEQAVRYVPTGSGTTSRYVFKPWLTTAWKHTSPKVWRFTVRPHVTFTDGEPLTAQAFKLSFDDEQKLGQSQAAGFFEPGITGIRETTRRSTS